MHKKLLLTAKTPAGSNNIQDILSDSYKNKYTSNTK